MKSAILLLILTVSVNGNNNTTLGSLPELIIEEILSIAIGGVVNVAGNCTPFATSEIEFWLYTKELNKTVLDPSNPSQIDATKPIVFLVHGWLNTANVFYIQEMKDAYIENIDEIQVIAVDWSFIALQDYFTAVCNAPQIGQIFQTFICNLQNSFDLNLSKIHIVGHSLGAQIAAFAAQDMKRTCGPVGRISALDPAGPLYQGLPDDQRLTKDDADFVDVIHTNAGGFGYLGDCGHVDFYVNCGSVQPGCAIQTIKSSSNITAILELPFNMILCNHQRSAIDFAESIGNDDFLGTSCSLCPTLCTDDSIGAETLVMGESTPTTFDKTTYLLFTNSKPPFANDN